MLANGAPSGEGVDDDDVVVALEHAIASITAATPATPATPARGLRCFLFVNSWCMSFP
jgi:hypothetical protein